MIANTRQRQLLVVTAFMACRSHFAFGMSEPPVTVSSEERIAVLSRLMASYAKAMNAVLSLASTRTAPPLAAEPANMRRQSIRLVR